MNENELVTLLERGWDCCTRLTVASDPHDIVTELFGVGLGHGVHPSSSVPRRHRLDVTYRCSSPPRRCIKIYFAHAQARRRSVQPRLRVLCNLRCISTSNVEKRPQLEHGTSI